MDTVLWTIALGPIGLGEPGKYGVEIDDRSQGFPVTDPTIRDSRAVRDARSKDFVILNLGCGSRTSSLCINIDWSPYLRLQKSSVGRFVGRALLRGDRLERFVGLDDAVVVHDLRKGIPAASASVDMVYSSHVLEHIDREHAPAFLREMYRVLRPGGVVRIVVPDLEVLAARYLKSIRAVRSGVESDHEAEVAGLIEQMVRRRSVGSAAQRTPIRQAERLLLGDARRRGETHQWMYDEVTLTALLKGGGFAGVCTRRFDESLVNGWPATCLDQDEAGSEYKRGSLYVEALRP